MLCSDKGKGKIWFTKPDSELAWTFIWYMSFCMLGDCLLEEGMEPKAPQRYQDW